MKRIIVICIIAFFLSCENRKVSIIKVSTEISEIIPFIEEFNNQNNNLKILIDSASSKDDCDIIIFRGEPHSSLYDMMDISHILDSVIKKEIFYDNLIDNVTKANGEITMLPVSFDLPGLIYKNTGENRPNIIKTEDFLTNENAIFSPYWNNDFIIWYYLSHLPNFYKAEKYFDERILLSTTNKIKEYSETKSWDVKAFNEKYMHLSPELLISRETIDYYYYNLSKYIRLDSPQDISFSLLSINDLIMTTDSISYIGINKKSKNKKNAEMVLSWIFNKDNQKIIIEKNFKRPELSTLFGGELSTIKEVTEKILPLFYPSLSLLLPKDEMIIPPTELPIMWDSLKKEVFIPTILKSSSSSNLTKDYDKFYSDWSKKHNK